VTIDYDHRGPWHTLQGPRAVLPRLFPERPPQSLLDVGCGLGTWLRAASEAGVPHVYGIDGIDIPADQLLVPRESFRVVDLSRRWTLGRTFDVALCLEVAEHLDPPVAPLLVETLTRHADLIVFSAACPGQPGRHHVNCQWPVFWQELFNARGYVCCDDIRWGIWNDRDVEVWYRQNMFVATRHPAAAGTEARLTSVIHPDFVEDFITAGVARADASSLDEVRNGTMPLSWYGTAVWNALASKVRRRWQRSSRATESVA
jgi:SAM-dependent methyltransferase